MKNEKEQLWPGQFVAARIVLKVEQDALVLPESAVQPGQNGAFVYVAKEGRAQLQNVQVDRQIDELVVISNGLNGGEEVIRDVPPTLANGSAIVLQGAEGKGGKGEGKGKSGKGKKSQDKDSPSKESVDKDAPGKEAKP